MDFTNETRQQKYRDRMQQSGKKQRVFFLSDVAMDALKKRKEETQAPSLNHALEIWLTTPAPEEKTAPAPEKILTDRQQKILDAAMRFGEVGRTLKQTQPDHPDRQQMNSKFFALANELAELTR